MRTEVETKTSTGTQFVHAIDHFVEVRYGAHALFRYVYRPDTPQRESPKPYFHPVRTLAGNVVTNYRPHDHVWHKGICMTWAQLSGQNFWGGPTYVHGQGYVQLPNNGAMEHVGWNELRCSGNSGSAVGFDERLGWITYDGETWVDERRRVEVAELLPDERYWSLDFTMDLQNTRGQPLVFGSPTTAGRPMAGYGGLFWRGPRSFLNGTILAGGGLSGPEVMGQRAPWLAFVGKHDGSGDTSTLIFVDRPGNPRYPTKWFVRATPYACASFAPAFDEELRLAPGEMLRLRYRIVIADGEWSRERIEDYVVITT